MGAPEVNEKPQANPALGEMGEAFEAGENKKPKEEPKVEDEKVTAGTETDEETIKERSKGYPTANKSEHKLAYEECIAGVQAGFHKGEKWAPGVTAVRFIWKSGEDGQLHGNEFIAISKNKPGEYYFFVSPKDKEKTKPMKIAPAKDFAAEAITDPREKWAEAPSMATIVKAAQWENMTVGNTKISYAMYTVKELVDGRIAKKEDFGPNEGVVYLIKDPNENNKVKLFVGGKIKG